MMITQTELTILPDDLDESSSQIDHLCDDVMWEIFRKLPLEDLIRIEPVCRRWQSLQERVLREKTRLVLLDEPAANYPEKADTRLTTAPSCGHLSHGDITADILLVPNMYYLVSFLYFIAPRLPNIRTLYVSIYWTAPEQLSQVLAKFVQVECLTLFSKPTAYCYEWTPLNNVLRHKYSTSMKHFVTNFHLCPEKHVDPWFEPKIEAVRNFIDNFFRRPSSEGQVAGQEGNVQPTPSPLGGNFLGLVVFRVKDMFAKWVPIGGRQTNNQPDNGGQGQEQQQHQLQVEEADLEMNNAVNNELILPLVEVPAVPSKWSRIYARVRASFVVCLLIALAKRIWCGKPHSLTCNDCYFKYLHQVEELHIPGHFNRLNDRVYSFSSTVVNNTLLKRFTIGDCKILHACSGRMFASLLYLDINDIWYPEYGYLYEKLAQCVNLIELRLHFGQVIEETTLDLIDYLEEGCVKQAEKGFLALRILVLDFPMASLSRQYFIKFRSIFPAIESLSVNVSRIKWYRRAKLVKLIEHPTTGLRHLKTLHILSNGNNATLDWLEGCTKIDTFNLTTLRLSESNLAQLKVFVKIALARASKKKTQGQMIRLEVTSAQIRKIKAKYTQMLARSGKSTLLDMVDNIRLVPVVPSASAKLVSTVSQYGVDTL